MLGDRKTVVLRGGAPWGFRLSGGGQTPVHIAKVRSRSKAALGGLAAGDTLISVNGISSIQQSLREINDIIDTVRDQLILEVQSTSSSRGFRHDSGSSVDTRENSPIRASIHRITPQPKQMDYYQYSSARTTPTYPVHNNYIDYLNQPPQLQQHQQQQQQRYMDSYGRTITNPSPSIFRTATITTNSPVTPIATARVQQFNYRPATSSSNYDTPRSYNDTMTSGYFSDTNDLRRSSISIRPLSGTPTSSSTTMATTNFRPVINQPPKLTVGSEQNYYSDSEYVTSGPRYYKITRQINSVRRPSNVVLPIRSITSKAYDPYVSPPSPPKQQPQPHQQQQQLFDVYRYQQEQLRLERERERERERQEQLQRQAAATRYNAPPRLTFPSPTTIDPEIGAELLKSPSPNKKRYADSSFFRTPYNTYPTIDEQKKMAHQIASILESGDPSQKGSSKFEKQRQRADKFTVESESTNYRPLRPLQTNEPSYSNPPPIYYNSSAIPECIKHSLDEAQYINPLRYVGAPEEFKQIHMQEHVTHTAVPPQAAMNLVADLNQNRGKGAALFQKRKARSEKWIIDENNVKKQNYPPTNNYIAPANKPWGQRAPSWSDNEGQSQSPSRGLFSPPSVPLISPSPPPIANGPRFGDFNARPKGFGTWNAENQSPRGSIDGRKPLTLNIEPSIREGIAESHTRPTSQPWSPPFNYPSDSLLTKWTPQDYQNSSQQQPQYNGSSNRYSAPQQQHHFTDL